MASPWKRSRPSSGRTLLVLQSALLLLGACAEEGASTAASVWFTEVQSTPPLPVHRTPGEGPYFMPEIMGSGCALLDYDGDGDLDLYLVHADSSSGNRMLRQSAPFSFDDVTEATGTGDTGTGMGATAGDVDADGRMDLYVTNVGPDVLYRNVDGHRFEDVSGAAAPASEGWSASAAFVDYDGDGDLDLFVTRYLAFDPVRSCRDAAGRPEYCGPKDFPGVPDVLLQNDGSGRFEDVSAAVGLRIAALRGLGIACADLTADGVVDLFVANDDDPNQLWVRQPDGTLADEALARGVAYDAGGREEAGMGVALADLDGDGDLDVLLSHLAGQTDTLYLQVAPGRFRDETRGFGLDAPTRAVTGFGLAAFDVDRDGACDVVQVNGHVARGSSRESSDLDAHWRPYAQAATLLSGDGTGFVPVRNRGGTLTSTPRVGRGLATGDLDGDGDLDLVTTATADRPRLYRNDASGTGVSARALEADGTDALGATVTAHSGNRRFTAVVPSGSSYLSGSAPAVHLGLGSNREVDHWTVTWPDGTRERFGGCPAGTAVVLRRGAGE